MLFRLKNGKVEYLLLQHPTHWSFPKGHVESAETVQQASIRELTEETGLNYDDIEIIDGFKEQTEYTFPKGKKYVLKRVIYFLARTKSENPEIVISEEHIRYMWASLKTAEKVVKFANMIEILRKAHRFICTLYGF